MARYFTAASSQVLEWSGTVSLSLPFTLACWAYRPVATTEHGLISLNGNANGRAYSLAVMSSSYGNPNVVRARHSEDPFTGSETASPANSTTGAWQHFMAVFTAANSRVAASNGSFGTTDTGAVAALTLNSGISIGALFRAANRAVWGNGGIAIPAIWNGALTAGDGARLAAGAWPLDVQGDLLTALWLLDEKSGGARDVVGGYNLTASTSEPTWVPDPPILSRSPKRQVWVPVASGGSYTLTAQAGSYALTGQAAALAASRRLAADAGAFALDGIPAGLFVARIVTADAGTFVVTGYPAAAGITLTAEAGAFGLSGQAADLLVARRVTAEAGAFVVAGSDAALIASRNITADGGAFGVAGIDAELAIARRMLADTGIYALDGSDASLIAALRLAAETGAYLVTGNSAQLGSIAAALEIACIFRVPAQTRTFRAPAEARTIKAPAVQRTIRIPKCTT